MTSYEYKSVVKETMRGWLLEMNGGAKNWFPKNVCRIKVTSKMKKIFVPQWLVNKMITDSVEATQCKTHYCDRSLCGCKKG